MGLGQVLVHGAHHVGRRVRSGHREHARMGAPDDVALCAEAARNDDLAVLRERFPDGVEIDTLIPKFNRSNRYGLDRAVQRKVSFSGMPFIPTQDQAMTEGMGYVCDRSLEHLGTTDLTIIHMRRLMLRLLKNMEQGIEPPGAREPELYRVRPLDVVSENAELPDVLEEYREETLLPV